MFELALHSWLLLNLFRGIWMQFARAWKHTGLIGSFISFTVWYAFLFCHEAKHSQTHVHVLMLVSSMSPCIYQFMPKHLQIQVTHGKYLQYSCDSTEKTFYFLSGLFSLLFYLNVNIVPFGCCHRSKHNPNTHFLLLTTNDCSLMVDRLNRYPGLILKHKSAILHLFNALKKDKSNHLKCIFIHTSLPSHWDQRLSSMGDGYIFKYAPQFSPQPPHLTLHQRQLYRFIVTIVSTAILLSCKTVTDVMNSDLTIHQW